MPAAPGARGSALSRRSNSVSSASSSTASARRMVSMRTPDTASRNCRPASVRAHSTTRRSSESMAALDQPVPLDPADEAGRGRRGEVEHVGDPAHRLGALELEPQQQPELAEADVADRRRRHAAGHAAEQRDVLGGNVGQPVVGGKYFRHTRIVHASVKYWQTGGAQVATGRGRDPPETRSARPAGGARRPRGRCTARPGSRPDLGSGCRRRTRSTGDRSRP